MKKRITVEHLRELTPEQQERLREWWRPQIGDMFVWQAETGGLIGPLGPIVTHVFGDGTFMAGKGVDSPEEYEKDECLPLFSIGQMIELIFDKTGELPQIIKAKGVVNDVFILVPAEFDLEQYVFMDGKEGQKRLTNALWVTVKAVL